MPENDTAFEHATNPDVRYEKSDARIAGVFAFAVGLMLLAFGIYLGVAAMCGVFRERIQKQDAASLEERGRLQLPRDVDRIPAPVLQQDESADLKRLRDAEEKRLHEYGWVDAKAGVVHMPVADAMRLLADPRMAARHGIRIENAKPKGGK